MFGTSSISYNPGPYWEVRQSFRDTFEKPLEEEGAHSVTVAKLKERLFFGTPHSFILRRDKSELRELPSKYDHKLECSLSETQLEWHIDLLNRAHMGGEENHPFALIHYLMRVSQHPALVPRFEPVEAKEALDQCPKLQVVMDCLRRIRCCNEKVLVFTRSLDMQQLLALVIGHVFGIPIDIINGTTARKGVETHSGAKTRQAIVRRFKESRGFNVLILSPDVAGIGLTLTEANHVIHYGRWWNPAKESQATDRVYRIGQEKEVHVYYPIARHPTGKFETFDQKLDALIDRRKALAMDFLAPLPTEADLEKELFEDVAGARPGVTRQASRVGEDDLRKLTWDRFEALVALLEERSGARVLLTPKSGDGGIDVVAVRNGQLRLIQCKHTQWSASVDENVILEMLSAFDAYRSISAATARGGICRPVLVTNGLPTKTARGQAKERDVDIISCKELVQLLRSIPCTFADIELMERRRLSSLAAVRSELQQMVQRARSEV